MSEDILPPDPGETPSPVEPEPMEPEPLAPPESPEPPESRGIWQCLAPKGCQDAAERRPFEGVAQAAAQARTLGEPIRCPACGGTSIIYIRDITAAKAAA